MLSNDTGVRPIRDRVLVRRDPPTSLTPAGLHLIHKTWPTTGTVLAVGPWVPDLDLQPGARVLVRSRPSSALVPDDREPGERDNTDWGRVVMLRYGVDARGVLAGDDQGDILGIIEEA